MGLNSTPQILHKEHLFLIISENFVCTASISKLILGDTIVALLLHVLEQLMLIFAMQPRMYSTTIVQVKYNSKESFWPAIPAILKHCCYLLPYKASW